MTRRLVNRLLAAVLAILVAAAAVIVVIEVVAFRLHKAPVVVHWPTVYARAQSTAWTAPGVRIAAGALVVLGLVLLVVELRPTRPTRLQVTPLASSTAAVDTAFSRHGVAAAVRLAVQRVSGVRTTDASASARRLKLRVGAMDTARVVAPDLRDRVETAAKERLDSLDLVAAPTVALTITPRKS